MVVMENILVPIHIGTDEYRLVFTINIGTDPSSHDMSAFLCVFFFYTTSIHCNVEYITVRAVLIFAHTNRAQNQQKREKREI